MRIRCEVTRFRTWPDLLCCMKASYSAYCHHHIPCPQAGISRPGARRPGDQLQEQLSYAGPGDWWAYCLSPVLPALAADQTLGGLTWEPIWPDGLGGGGATDPRGLPGAGADLAWHISWRILGLCQAW